MDIPQTTAADDPLAQPTRARLFALLAELKRPAGTAELAERLGLHPNGVRLHLERMHEAGLVLRGRAGQMRGRPRDAWTIAPQARPAHRPPSAYGDLARWLARAMRSPRGAGLRAVETTGREVGREIAPRKQRDGEQALATALTGLGFQPTVRARSGTRMTLCLGNCPYRDAVRENQPIVCALHRGITRGLMDALLPKAKLSDFIPHDPDEAGCVIELSGVHEGETAGTPPTHAREHGQGS